MHAFDDTVRVRFTKWNGAGHWAFDMERIGEDEYGIWLWADAGTELRRGDDKIVHVTRGFVKLITPDRWWTAVWNDGGGGSDGTIDVYVDISTPATWEGDVVRLIDLDLDVIRRRDGTVEIADEDEFAEHRVRFGYPDHVVDEARTVTARVSVAVERREEPFGTVGERWIEVGRGR